MKFPHKVVQEVQSFWYLHKSRNPYPFSYVLVITTKSFIVCIQQRTWKIRNCDAFFPAFQIWRWGDGTKSRLWWVMGSCVRSRNKMIFAFIFRKFEWENSCNSSHHSCQFHSIKHCIRSEKMYLDTKSQIWVAVSITLWEFLSNHLSNLH